MMKRKGKPDYIAISLLISSIALIGIFVTACVRKKSLVAALTAVAALNTAAGWWFVTSRRKKHGGYLFDLFDEGSYEVFSDDEAASADRAVRSGLYRKRAAERPNGSGQLIRAIPIDETATEAEFAK